MLEFLSKDKCSGCTACVSICPKSCIDMVSDTDGFMYPEKINQNCINCGLCKKVCPIIHKPIITQDNPIAAALRTKSDDVWEKSSSGGAFYELSRIFLEKYHGNALIYAARFDGTRLIHDSFSQISEISPFQKSKYLQSDIRGIFKSIKNGIRSGKYVLFVGTPCQVAGLRNFMGEESEKLLCVDFVCHGVGSPGVFHAFLKNLEEKNKKHIDRYEFRAKKGIFGNYERYCSKIVFKDGSVKYADKDSYASIFLKQLCTRRVCNGDCPFRSIPRQGDITLADFNGKSIVFPDLCDEKNYSAIVFNTAKGKTFKTLLESATKYFSCDIEQIKHFNPLIYQNAPGNPKRDEFMKMYSQGIGYESLVSFAQLRKTRLSAILMKYIPWKLKFLIFRIYRAIKH